MPGPRTCGPGVFFLPPTQIQPLAASYTRNTLQQVTPSRQQIEHWYSVYGPALLLFGIALTRDPARAQDAVHQVFLRLLQRTPAAQINEIRTYLFSAVRNAIVSAQRKPCHTPLHNTGEPWFELGDRDYLEEATLRRALDDLPPDQREVTVLHVWGGLTFAECAQVLAINANTAAARYRYALGRLREALGASTGAKP
jgi:RNA polymerase sigma-70 factor (ECF subfamily)